MTFKEIQKNWTAKSRVYKLRSKATPPLRQIRSKHSHNSHLLHWDETTKQNKELRFYTAAKSPFVEDQPKENVMVEHIFFKEGYLFTQREDVALQQFLTIHPDNGGIFEEMKPEATAEEEVNTFEARAKAYTVVQDLDIDEVQAFMYAENGDSVFTTSMKELKRDLWVIADQSPEYLLEQVDDISNLNKFIARKAEKFDVIKIADGGRTFKWGKGSKTICSISADLTPYGAMAEFFLTDDGPEAKKLILEKLKAFE